MKKQVKEKVIKSSKKVVEKKLHKIFLYTIIVNYGYAEHVMKLLREWGSNAQLAFMGKGTAKKEALHFMGLENNNKEIIMALVDDTCIEDIKKEIQKYFNNNKKVMGFAFKMKLTSVVGQKVYHFLTNTF